MVDANTLVTLQARLTINKAALLPTGGNSSSGTADQLLDQRTSTRGATDRTTAATVHSDENDVSLSSPNVLYIAGIRNQL